jgi:hypothetical protein
MKMIGVASCILYRRYAVNVNNTCLHKGGIISGENVNLRSKYPL